MKIVGMTVLYDMGLHDSFKFELESLREDVDFVVLRVPGHWLYIFRAWGEVHSVKIPYSEEFLQQENHVPGFKK